MCMDVAAKYFWPHYKTTIAEVCASCASFQQHGRSQQAQPLRLALGHVTRPMNSVGLDLFTWKGGQHLVMVDHFSSMPFYSRMARTTAVAVAKQLEVWFNMFGAVRFVRADRGPPFSSAAFLSFCKSWNISLNLTAPYCPTSSGGAERSIGVLKEILKNWTQRGLALKQLLQHTRQQEQNQASAQHNCSSSGMSGLPSPHLCGRNPV